LRSAEQHRRPRLDDVAAAAKVSPATVSLVLREIAGPSESTRRHVMAVAARLGYRPDRAASALASHRSRLIGMVMDINNPFHTQLVEDVYEVAEDHGYHILLSTLTRSNSETNAIETLLDSRCEALVLLGTQIPTQRITALGKQLPLAVVGRAMPASAGLIAVRTDDQAGLDQAVQHLTSLGHRSIAYVDGGPGTAPTFRRRAYQGAMRRHQLADHIHIIQGGQTENSGAHAASSILLERPLPTAVITFNDRCAMGFMDSMVRARIDIPTDMSVIGYDNSPIAGLTHINLTTISQNTHELSQRAMSALIDRLETHRGGHLDVVVPPQLVVRGTTGGPRRTSSRSPADHARS